MLIPLLYVLFVVLLVGYTAYLTFELRKNKLHYENNLVKIKTEHEKEVHVINLENSVATAAVQEVVKLRSEKEEAEYLEKVRVVCLSFTNFVHRKRIWNMMAKNVTDKALHLFKSNHVVFMRSLDATTSVLIPVGIGQDISIRGITPVNMNKEAILEYMSFTVPGTYNMYRTGNNLVLKREN